MLFGIFSMMKHRIIDLNGVLGLLFYVFAFLSFFASMVYKWGTDESDLYIVDIFKKRLLRNVK
jgi:hypothetical protein